MKLINEYTKQELIKLETKEIDKIIKLHLANAGIAIPKKPIEPEYEDIPEQDTKIFSIAGVGDLYFDSRELAEECAKILRNNYSKLRSVHNDYFNSSVHQRSTSFKVNQYSSEPPSVNDLIVKETTLYSTDLYTQIKAKLEANDKLQKNYDKKQEEFETAEENARKTIDIVWETIREAQTEHKDMTDKLEIYRDYLDLADGEKDVAWKFMKKAHPVTQKQEDYILANI